MYSSACISWKPPTIALAMRATIMEPVISRMLSKLLVYYVQFLCVVNITVKRCKLQIWSLLSACRRAGSRHLLVVGMKFFAIQNIQTVSCFCQCQPMGARQISRMSIILASNGKVGLHCLLTLQYCWTQIKTSRQMVDWSSQKDVHIWNCHVTGSVEQLVICHNCSLKWDYA